MPRITEEAVLRIAKLAKIELDDGQLKELTQDMAKIVTFADKLTELETAGVPITTHAVAMQSVLRGDVTAPSFDRQTLLMQAAEHDDTCYIVPKVLE